MWTTRRNVSCKIIIRVEFKNYTIVAVSHRLEMIMDFNKIVVMDMVEIVELGNPMVLVEEEGSRFGELVNARVK
jgi:ABC-type multidrug transport system fused ATPase/permease subunit